MTNRRDNPLELAERAALPPAPELELTESLLASDRGALN